MLAQVDDVEHMQAHDAEIVWTAWCQLLAREGRFHVHPPPRWAEFGHDDEILR